MALPLSFFSHFFLFLSFFGLSYSHCFFFLSSLVWFFLYSFLWFSPVPLQLPNDPEKENHDSLSQPRSSLKKGKARASKHPDLWSLVLGFDFVTVTDKTGIVAMTGFCWWVLFLFWWMDFDFVDGWWMDFVDGWRVLLMGFIFILINGFWFCRWLMNGFCWWLLGLWWWIGL